MTELVRRTRRRSTSTPDAEPADGSAGAGAVVFTDIVGFTELTDVHGDDTALELVERHVALAAACLPEGARIVKELGDGLLLWFEDPFDALTSSLDLQDRVAARRATDGVPMRIRIGVHWGAPKQRGGDLIGRDVNLASRVTDLVGPGEVLCTGAMVDAVRARSGDELPVRFEFLGATFVKGVAEPVPVHRVTRV